MLGVISDQVDRSPGNVILLDRANDNSATLDYISLYSEVNDLERFGGCLNEK